MHYKELPNSFTNKSIVIPYLDTFSDHFESEQEQTKNTAVTSLESAIQSISTGFISYHDEEIARRRFIDKMDYFVVDYLLKKIGFIDEVFRESINEVYATLLNEFLVHTKVNHQTNDSYYIALKMQLLTHYFISKLFVTFEPFVRNKQDVEVINDYFNLLFNQVSIHLNLINENPVLFFLQHEGDFVKVDF